MRHRATYKGLCTRMHGQCYTLDDETDTTVSVVLSVSCSLVYAYSGLIVSIEGSCKACNSHLFKELKEFPKS